MLGVRRVLLSVLVLLPLGCGEGEPTATGLQPAKVYDIVGVGRVLPDGLVPTRQLPFLWTLRDVTAGDTGDVVFGIEQKGGAGHSVAAGTYDRESGRLLATSFFASLTSSVSENVTSFGGDATEGLPIDSVADELSGFVETRQGQSVFEGRFLAVSRIPQAPAKPDTAKIRATTMALGEVQVVGDAGAVPAHAAVEIFVYTLGLIDPGSFFTKADGDGAFDAKVEGLADDHVVVRARTGGTAGDGRWVVVTR